MRRALVLLFAAVGACSQKDAAPAEVLQRLDAYQAPQYPADTVGPAITDREAYDYRKRDGQSVPSKPMTLVLDVCINVRHALDDTFKPQLATHGDVSAAIDLYRSNDWRKVAGLRPWTNWNFVRSLSDADRTRLIDEITTVLKSGRLTAEECRYG